MCCILWVRLNYATTHQQPKYIHHHLSPPTISQNIPTTIHLRPLPPTISQNISTTIHHHPSTTKIQSFLYENHCESYKKLASRSRAVLFTYFFSYTYTLRFCWEIKSCCHRWLPQQTRPQITVQSYILRDCSSVRISFNMINNRHTLPIV